jgi:L-iditol 2-dehydrogenase
MRNRAAIMHGPHNISVEEIPVPLPGPDELLVHMRAVGVCGSDVHYYEHGRIGSSVVREPLILGHESSGIVVGGGSRVAKHSVGERVALEPGVPCRACRECSTGRYNLCQGVRFFGTPPVDGAFAKYVTIHEDFAFPLPDHFSDDAGALIEPLSVGIWACRKAGVQAGDHVLVTGAGPIGLLTMQAALAFGATEVTVTDVNQHRLQTALRTGATNILDVSRQSLAESAVEADALIECSGSTAALKEGICCLRRAAVAVVVGMGSEEEAEIPLSLIQRREINLTGTFRYANTYPTAIGLVSSGKVNPEAIVTGHFSLDDTERALRASKEDPATIKAVVVPD